MLRATAILALVAAVAGTALLWRQAAKPNDAPPLALPAPPLGQGPGTVVVIPDVAKPAHPAHRAAVRVHVPRVAPSHAPARRSVAPTPTVVGQKPAVTPATPKPPTPHKPTTPPKSPPAPPTPTPTPTPAPAPSPTTPVAPPTTPAAPTPSTPVPVAPPEREPASNPPPTVTPPPDTTPTSPAAPPVDSRPGYGNGDSNHDHTGPPGQSKDKDKGHGKGG
jgi:hypothetical protein